MRRPLLGGTAGLLLTAGVGSTTTPTVPTKPAAGRLPVTGEGVVAGLIGLALLGGGAMPIILGRRPTT